MGAFREHLLCASLRQESPHSLGGLSVHLKTSHCGCQGQGPGNQQTWRAAVVAASSQQVGQF